MLDKIRPPGLLVDHLFIGTARFQYFTLAWNPETQDFETSNPYVDITDQHLRDSQSRDRVSIDPRSEQMVLELFAGVVSLVRIKHPKRGGYFLDMPEQIRITELRVIASTFLYTEVKRPKYAILYYGVRKEPRLATYRIWLDDKGTQLTEFNPDKERENEIADLCPGANMLIAVPKGEEDMKRYIYRNVASTQAHLGGVIVVGETRFTYLDDESRAIVECALDEPTIFAAWERIDTTHYLLSDEYGRLWMLTMLVDIAVVNGMDVREIGRTSKATKLVHLRDGIVYVASHEGDSQVIRADVWSETPRVEVLQTLDNIAPVLDFTIMDMGNREGEAQTNEYSSGQARLVTGSGVFQNGSLRSVRSGVGLEDIGILADMPDVRGVFSLKSGSDEQDDTLLVSFSTETRIFKFDHQGEIEEVEDYRNLAQNSETLIAMNISSDVALQITSTCARLCTSNSPAIEWRPPKDHVITAASATKQFALLAINGQTLVSLDVTKLTEVKNESLSNEDQIACVHVPQDFPQIGVVGLWKSGSISILDLKTLQVLHSEALRRDDNASIPRNIALTQILPRDSHGPTLFVAMEDGIVLTFSVNRNDYSLSSRKSIILGTQQARLEILPRFNGISNIFATCEHPSLIYGSEGKIIYSAVTADDATCVCSFDSTAYPDSIVLASTTSLKISRIDTERRTHVKTLHMGQTVRRLAYSAKGRAFGIGCIKRELVSGVEQMNSTFKLVDEVVFRDLGKPYRLGQSGPAEIIECVARAELPVQYSPDQPLERFLVGTTYLEEEVSQTNSVTGRLLVFGVDSSRSPYLVTSVQLKGACRQIGFMDGKVVAALMKTVVVYRYEERAEDDASLIKLATYRPSLCPIDIAIRGNIIAVADLMKSVALVEFIPGEKGEPDTLEEVARHYLGVQATAVVDIEEGTYLESDADGNLILLRRNEEGVTFEDRKRLEVIGEINLGEMVNRIRKVEVQTSSNAVVVPKAFLGTVGLPLFRVCSFADITVDGRRYTPLRSDLTCLRLPPHVPAESAFTKDSHTW